MDNPLINYGPEMQFAGDVMQGIGSYMQGEETSEIYSYNAGILDDQANQVMVAAGLQKEEIGMEEEGLLSTQKAMYSKAGVTQSGSPTDVALQTATNYEFDKLVTDYNAKVQAANLQSKANVERYYGKVAESQGKLGLAEGLLKGGLSLMGV